MEIRELLTQYQNALANTGNASASSQGVEQLVKTLAGLEAGQIFEGTVNSVKGSQVILGLSSGQNLTARLDKGMQLTQGQSVFFQVKSNDGNTIAIRPVSVGGAEGNPTIRNALSQAQVPLTQATLQMVDEMMKNKMSIDSHSLSEMARQVALHPDAKPSSVVMLQSLGIPLTDEFLQVFENYKVNEGALLKDLSGLADSVAEAAKQGGGTVLSSVVDVLLPGGQISPEAVLFEDVSHSVYEEAQALEEEKDPSFLLRENEEAGVVIGKEAPLTGQELREFPMGSLGRAMSPEGMRDLNQLLRGDAAFLKKYPGLFEHNSIKADASAKDVLLALTEHFGKMSGEELEGKLQGKALKELLRAVLEDKYTLEPKELLEKGSVDKLYRQLHSDMENISDRIGQTVPNVAQSVQAATSSVQNNLDFIREVNQMYTYMQLPVKLSGQNATGDLYVYRNKKKASEREDGEISAFLHFDLEHLGSTDISVKLKNKSLDTKFNMADDASFHLIEDNIHILQAKLEELGYQCRIQVSGDGKPMDFVNDFLKQDVPKGNISGGEMLRYSFDVRA
ncbi:hook-length control protein FliK [Lachnospiraceae bacterium C10]|nr:hook-length control protein FliK [Lachnospiraceae bacterium C10]